MKYQAYITTDNGNGAVQCIGDWDGEGIIEYHLNAFDRNAVLSIEQVVEEK